jgi:phosphorylase kinase alpha/beta subunit
LIAKGEEALHALLPRESPTKFCDLAQLSLIFPYNLLDRSLENHILENIEYHLVKARGVIRYKTDKYYNRNTDDKWSEEAEWTMGLPWLAIIYAQRGDKEKAEQYLRRTEAVLYDGKLPELYYSNSEKPNENIPLGWAESLYLIAMLEVQKMV